MKKIVYRAVDGRSLSYWALLGAFGLLIALGAGSFFFQEGHGDAYEQARYGILKVAPDGGSVLVGLADAGRRPIRP